MSAFDTSAARGRLVDELLKCDVFRRDDKRGDVVAALPFYLKQEGDPEERVLSIVKACGSEERRFGALFDAVRLVSGESLQDGVFAVLDEELTLALKWKDLDALKALLAAHRIRVPREVAEAAWLAAVGNANEPPELSPGEDLLSGFLDHAAARSPEAFFAFLEGCRNELGGYRGPVAEWEEAVARREGFALEGCRAAARGRCAAQGAAAPSPDARRSSLLFIRAWPLSQPPGHLLLHGWRQEAGAWERIFRYGAKARAADSSLESAPIAENVLPREVRRMIERALHTKRFPGELRIEMALPFSLLSEAIDEWPFKSGFDELPIGRRYPVVLRSWDRLFDEGFGDPRQRLMDNWDRLDAEPAGHERCFWGCERALSGAELRRALETEKALAFLSLELGSPTGAALREVLNAGVPLALWLRGHAGAPAATRDALARQLWPGHPSEWPGKIFGWRKSMPPGALSPDFACRGFALLRDDPHLPPREEDFEAPDELFP